MADQEKNQNPKIENRAETEHIPTADDAQTEVLPPVGNAEPVPAAVGTGESAPGEEKSGRKRNLLVGAGLALAGLVVGFGVGFGSGFAVGDDDRPRRGNVEMMVDGDRDDIERRGPGRGGHGPGAPRGDFREMPAPDVDSDGAERPEPPAAPDADRTPEDQTPTA